jgi:hypothetical protein
MTTKDGKIRSYSPSFILQLELSFHFIFSTFTATPIVSTTFCSSVETSYAKMDDCVEGAEILLTMEDQHETLSLREVVVDNPELRSV